MSFANASKNKPPNIWITDNLWTLQLFCRCAAGCSRSHRTLLPDPRNVTALLPMMCRLCNTISLPWFYYVTNESRYSTLITVTKLIDGKRGLIYRNGRDFPLCIEIRLILGPTLQSTLHVFLTWGYLVLGKMMELIFARPCVVVLD
jgi:hypothetical protein